MPYLADPSNAPVFNSTDVASEVMGEFSETSVPAPLNAIITSVTKRYLAAWAASGAPAPSPSAVENDLLAICNTLIRTENAKMDKGDQRYPQARTLTPWQIGQTMVAIDRVIRIAPNASETDREYDLLGMYQDEGYGAGTYTVSEDEIRSVARQYDASLSLNDFKEVQAILKEDAPRATQCTNRDLIAVNNGIVFYGTESTTLTIRGTQFHFEPKALHPFDPALVFTSKAHVSYVENAPRQVITGPDGTSWDVERWIAELFDQPGQEGLAELIWEILGAAVRPHVRWGKTAWFHSDAGNNGKGTLCALMRNLVGEGAHTSIPLSDFGKEFALEPLMKVNAVIVDENDVGTFIDKAANLKAIVTNDVIQINRKYRTPIAYQFWGVVVQCLNEFPRSKDKSESFYRRQLFVPFTKSFTGAERKEIKNDYLQRREVLEYVLWYVINRAGAATPGSYYEFSEPAATKTALNEYKSINDPVRDFWDEFRDQFAWDLLPFPFLYDLYKSWFKRVSPSGSVVGRQQFVADLVGMLVADDDWFTKPKNAQGKHPATRPGYLMDDPEPLIAEYELTSWYSPTYKGDDPDKIGRPHIAPNYRGVLRAAGSVPTPAPTNDAEEAAA